MSIQTYTDLQSAVARWIKRTDLTDVIPDFIELAEARFKSLLEIRAGEGEVSLSLEADTDLVPLPCDVKNPISLWVADITPRQLLDQVLAQNLPYTTIPSRPLYWAIDGEYIRVQGPADKQYPLWFRYQQTFRLGASRQTNYVLTNYPNVYLFGTLVEAALYTQDPNAASAWEAKLQDAVKLANDQEASANENVAMRTEFASMTRGRFNIYRGY